MGLFLPPESLGRIKPFASFGRFQTQGNAAYLDLAYHEIPSRCKVYLSKQICEPLLMIIMSPLYMAMAFAFLLFYEHWRFFNIT